MLLIPILLALGANAPAAGDEQCAAKPFTLNKPAAKVAPKLAPAKPKAVAEAKTKRQPAAKPAPKIDLDCKHPGHKHG